MRLPATLPAMFFAIAVVLAGGGPSGTPRVASAEGDVQFLRARARFGQSRNGEPRHKLKLVFLAPREPVASHEVEAHAFLATLDGTTLFDSDAGYDAYRSSQRTWRYRASSAGGRVRVAGDRFSGRIKVRVTRADLADLATSPAADLPFSLEVGGEALAASASFRVVDGRTRKWSGLLGPEPDPDPEPVVTREALLADLAARGANYFESGTASPAGGFDAGTLRCPSGALAEIIVLEAPPPGGADFFTDTAYVCRAESTYWTHREGGFPGVSLWLGPFVLP